MTNSTPSGVERSVMFTTVGIRVFTHVGQRFLRDPVQSQPSVGGEFNRLRPRARSRHGTPVSSLEFLSELRQEIRDRECLASQRSDRTARLFEPLPGQCRNSAPVRSRRPGRRSAARPADAPLPAEC